MPLLPGKKHIGSNIREMEKTGHPHNQALAAALHAAYGQQRADGGFVGSLTGSTPGRADKLPLQVPNGSHVIPADVVSALGGGNSMGGHKMLFGMFPGSKPLKTRSRNWLKAPPRPHLTMAAGGKTGAVPIMASDGEFVVSPEDVARLGKGSADEGHRHLDRFILHVRKHTIKKLKSLPRPAK